MSAPQRPLASATSEPPIIDASNAIHTKFSVAVLGPEKSGKTHLWTTFPQPIVAAYTDPNTATAVGFIQDGANIKLYRVDRWEQYEWFVRAAKNREFDAETLVVDSYSFLADRLVQKFSGPDGKVTIEKWGRVKDSHWSLLMDLLSSTKPPGRTYNVVVTCHDTDVTDDAGAVLRIRPAITGSFKDTFGKCFDSVFLSRSRVARKVEGGASVTTGAEYRLLTVPPNHLYACGDGVGGKGGRKALPPEVENTYEALCRAWGITK